LKRPLFVAGALALLLVPIGGIPAAGYVRGIAANPSVPTLVLLASAAVAFAGGPKLLKRRELESLAMFVLASAALVYPLGLGLTSFDPYALGYPDRVRALLLGLAPVAFLAWLKDRILVLLSLVLALAAYRFRLLESANLWDYLLDPWLSSFLAGFTIFARVSKSR
jgi:hypothetical protein